MRFSSRLTVTFDGLIKLVTTLLEERQIAKGPVRPASRAIVSTAKALNGIERKQRGRLLPAVKTDATGPSWSENAACMQLAQTPQYLLFTACFAPGLLERVIGRCAWVLASLGSTSEAPSVSILMRPLHT